MIVQPDFPEHWKTRRLVELTGDESAPMAVLRLWAHCQHSRRSTFFEMTPAQLASICRWTNKKIACHTALTKAGFVDKLNPKGFAAHEWNEYNAQLFQKWNARKIGEEKKSREDNQLDGSTDNRPIAADPLEKIDQTRPDQKDQRREEETRTDQTREDGIGSTVPIEATDQFGSVGSVPPFFQNGVGDGLVGLVGSGADRETLQAARLAPPPAPGIPTVEDLRSILSAAGLSTKWAKDAHRTLEENGGCDKDGQPIRNILKWLRAFVKGCESNSGRGKRNRKDESCL
jgi:hypothetical protein